MRITDRDTDDRDLAAQEREAERELVDTVMDRYDCDVPLPPEIETRCRRLSDIQARRNSRRAALLDGGREGGGAE